MFVQIFRSQIISLRQQILIHGRKNRFWSRHVFFIEKWLMNANAGELKVLSDKVAFECDKIFWATFYLERVTWISCLSCIQLNLLRKKKLKSIAFYKQQTHHTRNCVGNWSEDDKQQEQANMLHEMFDVRLR